MVHSRSPSPSVRRRRSRSRDRDVRDRHDRDRHDRERDRDRDRRRRRSRERERLRGRSPERERDHRHWSRSRSRSWSPSRGVEKAKNKPLVEQKVITDADLEGKSPDEQEMLKAMGFCTFDTTKGKRVQGNDVGAVHVILKRKYRQYMNRKGGFNRPLDFVA